MKNIKQLKVDLAGQVGEKRYMGRATKQRRFPNG